MCAWFEQTFNVVNKLNKLNKYFAAKNEYLVEICKLIKMWWMITKNPW